MENLDKNLVRSRFRRSVESYDHAAEVQRLMAEELLELFRLATGERDFPRILELGCGSGILTDRIEQSFDYGKLYLLDLVEEWSRFHRNRERAEFIAGDVERIPLPGSLDLILSNAVIQWMSDLPALLKKLAGALNPGGLLAVPTFGPENLYEIADLTGSGLRYLDPGRLQQLFSREFDLIGFRQELLKPRFDTPLAVLKHLKATGVTATGGPLRWTRKRLEEFSAGYRRFQLGDGKFPLTYHPITLIARKKA